MAYPAHLGIPNESTELSIILGMRLEMLTDVVNLLPPEPCSTRHRQHSVRTKQTIYRIILQKKKEEATMAHLATSTMNKLKIGPGPGSCLGFSGVQSGQCQEITLPSKISSKPGLDKCAETWIRNQTQIT